MSHGTWNHLKCWENCKKHSRTTQCNLIWSSRRAVVSDWRDWTRQSDRTWLRFFVPAVLLSTFILLLLLSSSVSLSYFNLAVPMRMCLGKHSCMSSPFSIAILNATCSLRSQILLWWRASRACVKKLNYKNVTSDFECDGRDWTGLFFMSAVLLSAITLLFLISSSVSLSTSVLENTRAWVLHFSIAMLNGPYFLQAILFCVDVPAIKQLNYLNNTIACLQAKIAAGKCFYYAVAFEMDCCEWLAYYDGVTGLVTTFFFVLAVLIWFFPHLFSLLLQPYLLPLFHSYFNLAVCLFTVPMHKCLGEHLCMTRHEFPIFYSHRYSLYLDGTCSLRSVHCRYYNSENILDMAIKLIISIKTGRQCKAVSVRGMYTLSVRRPLPHRLGPTILTATYPQKKEKGKNSGRLL